MKIQGLVNEMSQSEVLRKKMSEKEITHEQTIRADITNVRVGEPRLEESWFGGRKAAVFFCNIGSLIIREEVKAGDGGQLPDQVTVKGLAVERSGFFNLENALISSNGVITIAVDDKTRVVHLET